MEATTAWTAFGVISAILLGIDLFAHRRGHGTTRKSAVIWSFVWVGAGLLFALFVWFFRGWSATEEYLAAYLMEKSLSLDNLFVFLVIFRSLSVPQRFHHKVLFWGIVGAIVFRAVFIFVGLAAIRKFSWISMGFGTFLLLTAWHVWKEDPSEKRGSKTVEWLGRFLPVTSRMGDGEWTLRVEGNLQATPLLLSLCAIEVTDIMFAIDSVPAVFAVSRDPFIVYSSNIFAILGLRALYTALEHSLNNLPYLHYGLAGVLGFAGVKLIVERWLHVSPLLSVGIIISVIGAAVVASIRKRGRR